MNDYIVVLELPADVKAQMEKDEAAEDSAELATVVAKRYCIEQ